MENKDKKVTSTKPAAVKEEAVVKPAEKAAVAAKDTKPAEKAAVAAKDTKPAEKPAAVVAEEKPAAKVVEEKKEGKPEAKEAPAKKGKPGRKPGKTAAKKKPVEKVEEVYVQFQELEITTKEIVDKAKQIYIAEGHRESSIKSLRLYIKPDEHMAYYVINEKMTGSIGL